MATIPRCSVFNGTVLPNKPEFDATKYPNWLILYGTNSTTGAKQYIWLACSKPFLKYAEGVYVYPADADIIGHGANASTCTWSLGTIAKEEGPADYYTFSGTYVWSFQPIYLYSDQTVIAHQAGDMVTDWDAEEPTITSLTGAEILTDEGTGTGYWQGDTATALTCTATVSDGGTLSYKWYRNDTYVASGSSYTPSTATAGSFLYQCVVTNTRTAASGFSDVDTIQSDILAIVVTAKEDPDTPDSPDTPVAPDVKASKHKHIIGYVLRQCGVPMAEMIAEMLGKVKKTSSLYLYGTPSNGVKYNGVELPDIETVWDKETYTKAYVCEVIDGAWGLCTLNGEMYHESNGFIKANGQVQGRIYVFATTEAAAELLEVKVGEWTLVEEDTMEDGSTVESSDILWTSHDILNADGSVYLAATDPVHSGNIGLRNGDTVTYYDGAVATAYPEWDSVPYVAIVKTSKYDCVAKYSSCPIVWSDEGSFRLAENGTNRMYNIDVFKDGVWIVREPIENDLTLDGKPFGYGTSYEKILWSNHDIKNYDETEVKFAKTADPVPVSGIVDYVGDIPIYEMNEVKNYVFK